MNEQRCPGCDTTNKIEFSLRPGTKGPVMIRCTSCKKLLQVDLEERQLERE